MPGTTSVTGSKSWAAFRGWVVVASHLAVLFTFLTLLTAPLRGQLMFGNPYDAAIGRRERYPWAGPSTVEDEMPRSFLTREPSAPAATVSSDILRHPLSRRAVHLIQKAVHISQLGNHAAAIDALRDALVKQPEAEPYIESLLGMEYLETRQWEAAVASFGKAAILMPHETASHSNLGLSLAVSGQLELAEKELHKALQLDHDNEKAKDILEAVQVAQHTSRRPAP